MSNRERGAAHINIYYFVVLLLLFFGAIGWAYMEMNHKNEARKQVASAIANEKEALSKAALLQAYSKAISAVVGETGTFEAPKDFIGEAPEPLQNVSVPSRVEQQMVRLAGKLGVPTVSAKPIAKLAGAVANKFDSQKKMVETAEQARDVAVNKHTASLSKYNQDISAKTANFDSTTKQLNDQISSLRTEKERAENKTKSVRSKLRTTEEELSETKKTHRSEIVKKDKEINKRNLVIANIGGKIRLINPPHAEDGKIISASMAARVGWIDIGRKDMLQPGTRFRITAPISARNPKPVVKAIGTVISVENARARVRLSNIRDSFDPVVRGDIVSNDLYTPGLTRNIALIGRFPLTSPKPMVKKLLEKLGNKVSDKVTPNIDLVVVGSNEYNDAGEVIEINQSADYKLAQNLYLEIIPLNRIRNLLKVSE